MKRRLALKSEYVSELTTDELSSVAGGATPGCPLTGNYPTLRDCFELAPLLSLHRPCPTLDGCFTGTTGYTLLCSAGC